MLDLMEKKRLVERHRSSADRREILVELTPAGKLIVKGLIPILAAVNKDVTNVLTEKELNVLIALLDKVSVHVTALYEKRNEPC
jgi:DNA-binding MarR family transcriptional regulator